MPDRRYVVVLALAALFVRTDAGAQTLKVTLLGTGSPEPSIERFGPATLVEAAGARLLFDAGRGASQRLWQLAIPLGQIDGVFLTHLHSDHVVGLPDVWLSGFQQTQFGRRSSPLLVWGPTGTGAMVAALRQAFAEDVRSRSGGGSLSDSVTAAAGHDIQQGVIYDRAGVTVTAFAVDHGAAPFVAFGYRVESSGRSVVISGDTRPSENLVRFAEGADVLIHEVMVATPEAVAAPALQPIIRAHTSPEDAARIFQKTKPKLAVYTHVSLVAAAARRPALLEALMARTRSVYDSPVEIGEDLMTIEIADSVRVQRRTR
jgi:ribonuclease Z